MSRDWYVENWEQDWTDEHIYYTVTVDGKIVRCNIETLELYELDL